MTDDPINLNKARAEKAQDSRLWTAHDLLTDMLAQLERGEITADEIIVHWLDRNQNGGFTHHYGCAGVNFQAHLAILHLGLARVLSDWREK